jgi:hypothetical protein
MLRHPGNCCLACQEASTSSPATSTPDSKPPSGAAAKTPATDQNVVDSVIGSLAATKGGLSAHLMQQRHRRGTSTGEDTVFLVFYRRCTGAQVTWFLQKIMWLLRQSLPHHCSPRHQACRNAQA